MADLGALAEFFGETILFTWHYKAADNLCRIIRGTEDTEAVRDEVLTELCRITSCVHREAYSKMLCRLYGDDYEVMEKELTEAAEKICRCDIDVTSQERKEFLWIWLWMTAIYFGRDISQIMDACKGKDSY